MNLDQLKDAFERNKKPLGIAGAAAVGGLALLQARKRDSGGALPGGALPADRSALSAEGSPSYGSPYGYTAPYDSSSSDLLTAVTGIQETLMEAWEKQQDAPIPVPAAPPTSGLKNGFYKIAGNKHNVYQVRNGKLDYLTRGEFAALTKGTKPKITQVSKDSPIWQPGSHWLDKSKQTP